MGSRALRLLLFALLLLLPSPALAQNQPGSLAPPEQAPRAQATGPVAPVTLFIPSLDVVADIVPVGEDEDGAMTAPVDPDTVAWWSLGYGTGAQPGNVVLAAQVDWGGRLRVFGQLHRLGPGDAVIIHDELAREYRYEVVWSKSVRAEGAPVEEIFAASDTAELTLITCGGAFDPAARQYVDRLIVRAVKI